MNIPTKAGEYNWKDNEGFMGKAGEIHVLPVVDVGADFGNGHETHLRVFWRGGYYKLTPDEWDKEDCWPKEGWQN